MENIKISKLENGITVVTKEASDFNSVVSGYWVEAGGACETSENFGISHFLEHMAFKGTKTRTAKDIAEAIESVGGYTNAYTSKEVTAFYTKLLKEDYKLGIDILSDILQNSVFATAELERERGVVLQEICQTQDTPDDIIFDHFQSVAFADQSMGAPILGTESIVNQITSDDLRAYMNRYYNADNIVFASVGNVKHQDIIDYASELFFNFKSAPTEQNKNKYQYVGGTHCDIRDLEQVHAIIGFDGVAHLDPDYYIMSIFSSILGGGMSSKLFQEVREKRGLVYSIYSFASSYKNNGLFGIYAATTSDKLSELADVASTELLNMSSQVTEAEFKKTKAQFRSALLMADESNSSSCEQIVNHTMLFGAPKGKEEILQKINEITLEQVKKFTARVLSSKVSVITVGKSDCDAVVNVLSKNGIR